MQNEQVKRIISPHLSGLMAKEEIEKLGFTEAGSWESEEAEKKFLWTKIQNMKAKANENAKKYNEFQRKKQEGSV
jgi:cytochrome c oxidase assembly protein subunit 19